MEADRWRQVCDLFAAALDREPAERSELLAAIPDGDLRREVESLLAAHDAPGPLDRLAASVDLLRREVLASGRSSSPPATGATRLTPGRRLGRHEIRARLGAGGMGEVYRAYDTRLQREVAIKVLGNRILDRPGALQRVEQEARAVSALNHPNVVTLHDLGGDASFPYLVMELVEGDSVRQLLHGAWPLELLLHVAVQIADGLVAAHERGIVHRDLKPENVLVTRDWVAKIVDFGLAEFRVPATIAGGGEDAVTRPLQGTAGYVPPEVLAGAPCDPRGDQFSFGAILYEMAAGTPPFAGAISLEALTRSLTTDPPPLAMVRPDLPADFIAAVERCLRKDPEERYASTRDLLEVLRAVRRATSTPRPPGPRPRRAATLPAESTRLIGRDHDLAELRRLLAAGVRLVTLTGPGGTGKTRLAIRLGEVVAPEYPGGVIFVPLAAITDPALLGTSIAQAMGVFVSPTRPAVAGIVADLRNASAATLLILDNFEQIIEAAPVVSELLAACPELTVLVTSREVLHLRGEHGHPVAPLDVPDPALLTTPEALADCPSVTLFVERAQAANAGFRLTAANARAVAEVCAGLEGLPLALELAAAETRVLPPETIVARLDRRLRILAGGTRDAPDRQKTLRGTIDWSHHLLSDTERAAFRRLSVFAGGFTLEAALAVVDPFETLTAPIEEVIGALVDKSLIQARERRDGATRFSMLETLRVYALEKLVESGESERTRRAHAAYFLVLAEEGTTALASSRESGWVKRFETEHGNFRVALDWTTRQGDAVWGMRLALALFPFWERGEHIAEGRRRLDALLALDSSREAPTHRARALFAAGVLASTQHDLERGRALHRQSLAMYQQLGDRRGVVVALVALANQHVASGDHDSARALLERSLEVWEELGDRAGFARSLANLAFVARSQRRWREARALYQRAAQLFEGLGDRLSRTWAVDHEGDVAREQGDLEAAQELYRQALDAFRDLGDRWGVGSALADLGANARERREHGPARQLYREALANFVEVDHQRGVARILESLACVAADEGEAEDGLRLAAAAAALRERIGAPRPPAVDRELAASMKLMREALGVERARGAWREGAAMTPDEAVLAATSVPSGS